MSAGDDLKIGLTGANDASIILESAGTGVDAIKLDATAGGVDVSGNAASKFDVTGAALTLSTTTSGTLSVTSAGAFDIDGAAASSMTVTSADLQVETVTSGAITIDSAENIDMNAAGGVTIDGTAISIDGTSASNLTTTSANLTVSTVTSGTLAISSAGALDIDGSATTLDASTLSIDSTDTTNLTMTANDSGPKVATVAALNSGSGDGTLVLNAKTDIALQQNGSSVVKVVNGGVQMESGQAIIADTTGGFQFGPSGQDVNEIDTDGTFASASDTALATQLAIKTYVDSVAGAATIQLEAAVNIDARDVVAIALTGGDAGKAIKADADSADTCQVIGFAEAAATATNTVTIRTSGNLTGFTGLTAGNKLYASTTAGGVTATAPTGSGDVIFQVGYARSATEVIIVPQYIMELG